MNNLPIKAIAISATAGLAVGIIAGIALASQTQLDERVNRIANQVFNRSDSATNDNAP